MYQVDIDSEGLNLTQFGNQSRCSAFLANIDVRKAATVTFLGQTYHLPPWSVSILPDCRNTAFNTAKVCRRLYGTGTEALLDTCRLYSSLCVMQPLWTLITHTILMSLFLSFLCFEYECANFCCETHYERYGSVFCLIVFDPFKFSIV